MTSRDQLVFQIYQQALDVDESCRAQFVEQASSGDEAVMAEVNLLISAFFGIQTGEGDLYLENVKKEMLLAFDQMAFDGDQFLSQQQMGSYQILKFVGRGGMGLVYKARDIKLNRDVALKFLPPEEVKDQERLERFRREGKSVGMLNHPNIVTLFAVEHVDPYHFLVMEWIEGQSLEQLIPEQGFPLSKFLALASPIADALHTAHKAGIIHRDLKPANIMVTENETVKILDFGLAKQIQPDPENLSASTELITKAGRVMGTFPYMSPEQVKGKRITSVSDIFSLGIIFYEMATGQRPFKGENSGELISSILRDDPCDISELNHNLPQHLSRIVHHCLVKDPKQRCQSALDLRNQLEDLSYAASSGELTLSKFRRKKTFLKKGRIWLSLVLLFGCGLFLILNQGSDDFEKGINLYESGNIDQAITMFQNAIEKNPDHYNARYYLSSSLLTKSGRQREGLTLLEGLLGEGDLDDDIKYRCQASYFKAIKDYQSALEAYRNLDYPGHKSAYIKRQMANCLSMLSRFDESDKKMAEALALDPTPVNKGVRVISLIENSLFKQANDLCSDAIAGRESQDFYIFWPCGIANLAQGQWDEGIKTFQRLEESDSPILLSQVSLFSAKAAYLKGDVKGSRHFLNLGLSRDIQELQEREYYQRQLWLGRMAASYGRHDGAMPILEKIKRLEAEPFHMDLIRQAAMVHILLGQKDELKIHIQTLESIPKRYDSPMRRGFILQLKGELARLEGDFDKASTYLEDAFHQWDDAHIRFSRARILRLNHQPQAALEELDHLKRFRGRILRRHWPDLFPLTVLERARCHMEWGNMEESKSELKELLSTWDDPDLYFVREATALLKQISSKGQ